MRRSPSSWCACEDWVDWDDIWGGLLKAVGVRPHHRHRRLLQGLLHRRAARGVGSATTSSVVVASVLILVANYFIALAAAVMRRGRDRPGHRGARRHRLPRREEARSATFEVLRGLDLIVPRGRITVIIGRSGTGKSVTIKHVMGLLRPDARAGLGRGGRADEDERPRLRHVRERFGVRVPARGAVRLDERVREHRVPAASSTRMTAGDQREDQGEPAGRLVGCERGGQDAGRAVGRHAQARRPRPGARARPRVPAVRRAHHRPRSHLVGGDGPAHRRHPARAAGA
jgi:hypothetical protein